MRISQAELAAEYTRARQQWPFITGINDAHGMPPALLYALGSRETNLQNEIGDSGHGHGVFQLDDRSHQIPPGFDHDVRAQAQKAADMMVDGFRRFGDWVKACNYYNSGQPDTNGTAHGDYGPDVMERQAYLATLRTGGGPSGYSVHVYQRANVRREPNTGSDIVSYVVGGEGYPALCWTHGETITDNGVTNDIWVELRLRAGGVGYVSAVYLTGDERGGLPQNAHC